MVTAGASAGSATFQLGGRIADAVAVAGRRGGIEVTTTPIELRDLGHDLVDRLLGEPQSDALAAAADSVAAAEGLVVVTPTYNASFSGLFKLFIDVLPLQALDGSAVLLAATGGSGRHTLVLDQALRPLFAYLKAVVVPTSVFATQDSRVGGSAEAEALSQRVERAAAELVAQMVASVRARPQDRGELFGDLSPFSYGY